MINLLEDYIPRSIPEFGDFTTNPNLLRKVDSAGNFLPFYGNTVVFDLNEESKHHLQILQEQLYKAAGWMLSQKLDPGTFHMTLHDLVNGPELTGDLKLRMRECEAKAKLILESWKDQRPLRLKATWLFNMVNTSLVLGLAPVGEDSWDRLSEMYRTLETVVPLGYAMTPHITIAYFKPGTWSQYDLNCLRQALHPVELEVKLYMEDLHYQEFSDMNLYERK